jgi:hypothetical protein
MTRKIYNFEENSIILDQLSYMLGFASKDKELTPDVEVYLKFKKSMTESKTFFKKIVIYAYENNLGIMIEAEIFLPDGGEQILSKDNFLILLQDNFPEM